MVKKNWLLAMLTSVWFIYCRSRPERYNINKNILLLLLVKPPIVYLNAVRTCNSLIDTARGWQFICRNICRGCKYILYLLIILCICWL
jgi:hypothetical protein